MKLHLDSRLRGNDKMKYGNNKKHKNFYITLYKQPDKQFPE